MGLIIHNLSMDLGMKLMADLVRIDRFDASWTSIERRVSASLHQLKAIATVRSVGASTRIEGSRMTDDEVSVFLERLAVSKLEERDEQEVVGYFEAMDTIAENHSAMSVTENELKNLHKILMRHCEKDSWHKGNYKQVSNAVEALMADGTRQVLFKPTEPGVATQDAMRSLMEWYASDTETMPVIKAAVFVYEFLSIHPFQDGNGRLSRLLANLLLMKSGYAWIQYVSFEHEIESRKSEYYRILMQTQRHRPGENVTEWLAFFVNCLLNIQVHLEVKLNEDQRGEPASIREKRMLLFIGNHGGCSSGEMATKLNLALPTVKKSLKEMLSKGWISREGQGKSTGYFLV